MAKNITILLSNYSLIKINKLKNTHQSKLSGPRDAGLWLLLGLSHSEHPRISTSQPARWSVVHGVAKSGTRPRAKHSTARSQVRPPNTGPQPLPPFVASVLVQRDPSIPGPDHESLPLAHSPRLLSALGNKAQFLSSLGPFLPIASAAFASSCSRHVTL